MLNLGSPSMQTGSGMLGDLDLCPFSPRLCLLRLVGRQNLSP